MHMVARPGRFSGEHGSGAGMRTRSLWSRQAPGCLRPLHAVEDRHSQISPERCSWPDRSGGQCASRQRRAVRIAAPARQRWAVRIEAAVGGAPRCISCPRASMRQRSVRVVAPAVGVLRCMGSGANNSAPAVGMPRRVCDRCATMHQKSARIHRLLVLESLLALRFQ
jgi:hypothetical protein